MASESTLKAARREKPREYRMVIGCTFTVDPWEVEHLNLDGAEREEELDEMADTIAYEIENLVLEGDAYSVDHDLYRVS